jgi:hypothetical protein
MTLPPFNPTHPALSPIARIDGTLLNRPGQFDLCVDANLPAGERNWLGGVRVVVSRDEYEGMRRKHGRQ